MESCTDIIDKFDLDNGINVHKLKAGTLVLVATKNSLYKIARTDVYDEVMIQGGKYFPNPTLARFTGSTFGGSMIKIGWIGYGMSMEIHSGAARLKTSWVRSARIVGNGWEYDMGWK